MSLRNWRDWKDKLSPLAEKARTLTARLRRSRTQNRNEETFDAPEHLPLKDRLRSLPEKTKEIVSRWFVSLREIEWNLQLLVSWAEKAKALTRKKGFPIYGRIATIMVCAYFLSDLTALLLEKFIPEPPLVRNTENNASPMSRRGIEEYSIIFNRNLFNSRGLIPGEEIQPDASPDAPAVRTSLPITLLGTMILQDARMSLATLEDKSVSLVFPVRVGDEIPGKMRILEVSVRKVIFTNLQSGRKEFIDIPEDAATQNVSVRAATTPGQQAKVQPTGGNRFLVSRSEIDSNLANLSRILTQARAVPNFENGIPMGYKLFQIVPGSIYDQLGLKNGDIIAGLNGEPVNDPGKAFEMLNELKTTNHLELNVRRDGREQTMIYDIQ